MIRKRFLQPGLPLLLLGLCILFLLYPQAAAAGFRQGVQLCLQSVLPALFPFFVLCPLLMNAPAANRLAWPLRPLARICGLRAKQSPVVLLLSWLGGYAVGMQCIRLGRKSGQLSEREGVLLALLGCCSGPGFVIGGIGGLMLGSVRWGSLLFLLQLAANFAAAACIWPFCAPHLSEQPQAVTGAEAAAPPALPQAIAGAAESCLSTGACIVYFRMAAAALLAPQPAAGRLRPVLCAAMEISSGAQEFSSLGGWGSLCGVAACLSLWGLSVFLQLALLADGTIPLRPLVLARLPHLIFMQAGVRLCARLLPGSVSAFSSLAERVVPMGRAAPDVFLLIFALLCLTLYKAREITYNLCNN